MTDHARELIYPTVLLISAWFRQNVPRDRDDWEELEKEMEAVGRLDKRKGRILTIAGAVSSGDATRKSRRQGHGQTDSMAIAESIRY